MTLDTLSMASYGDICYESIISSPPRPWGDSNGVGLLEELVKPLSCLLFICFRVVKGFRFETKNKRIVLRRFLDEERRAKRAKREISESRLLMFDVKSFEVDSVEKMRR